MSEPLLHDSSSSSAFGGLTDSIESALAPLGPDNPIADLKLAGAAIGIGADAKAAIMTVEGMEGAGDLAEAVGPTAKELNQIAHVFPRVEKNLAALVQASGGSEVNALRAVQTAANQALDQGRLVAGPNGILPGNNLGAVLNVNGIKVQLIGGRVINGVVELGSFLGVQP